MVPTQRTLVLIKPDGIRRCLSGSILSRFERIGLKVVGLKLLQIDRTFAERHYTYEDIAVRHGEAIREQLLAYITDGPVLAMVLEGIECVAVVRKLCGPTEPAKAAPGTIRGDYCHQNYGVSNEANIAIHNVVHASATVGEANSEIALWFQDSEILSYRRSDQTEHYPS